MAKTEIEVRMLGNFSVTLGEHRVEDTENRARKVWLLLAYLIYHRRRVIPQSELLTLLWGEESASANPANALKTVLHRVRNLLDQLDPGTGRELILRRDEGYSWNNSVPARLDAEQFEARCRSAAAALDEETRLERCMDALSLYQGEFLSRLSREAWVVPLAAHYHDLYIQTVTEVLPLLEARGRWQELNALCRSALEAEPSYEPLYRSLMRGLLALGEQREAASVYEEMSKLLLSRFGVMPSEETRAIYRQAIRTAQDRVLPAGMVQEQLRESGSVSGALLCDYDFFKLMYQAQARSVSRSGETVHVALITLTDEQGNELAVRSLECAMENLAQTIKGSLRKGDIVSRCSASQYIILLPQANYENSCMVCERIERAFFRRYPHSPARLNCSVQPLEPV